MQNLKLSVSAFQKYQNNVIKIKDYINGHIKGMPAFVENPDGTYRYSGFGVTALSFIYYPIELHRAIVILSGSIRSGKTTAMLDKWLKYCIAQPKGLKAIIGVSKDTVYQNFLRDFLDYLDTFKIKYNYNQTTGYLKVKYGHGVKDWFVCKVIGSKDKGSIKYLRGVTLSGAYVEELTFIYSTFFIELLGRCSMKNSIIFASTNPDSPNHWAYKKYVKDSVNEDVEVWKFSLDDNPTLDLEYISRIKRQYKGSHLYNRLILGEWVIAEGLVYSNFKPEKHILSHAEVLQMCKDYKFSEYIIGIDWGYTAPMACSIIGVTKDFKYYQLAEFYETGKYVEDLILWIEKQKKELNINLWRYAFPDSEDAANCQKIRDKGFYIHPKPARVASSIDTVRSVMAQDRLFISDNCKNTINELTLYRYPTEEERQNKSYKDDEPIKENDHAMDGCVRYPIAGYESKYNKSKRW